MKVLVHRTRLEGGGDGRYRCALGIQPLAMRNRDIHQVYINAMMVEGDDAGIRVTKLGYEGGFRKA